MNTIDTRRWRSTEPGYAVPYEVRLNDNGSAIAVYSIVTTVTYESLDALIEVHKIDPATIGDRHA